MFGIAESPLQRRYAVREVQQNLHQATFREAVVTAYKGRYRWYGLPEPLLLDAAHIIQDGHDELGKPVVPNGIPMWKIHHAAVVAHLIGISPDYRLHIAHRLLVQTHGPMLEALRRPLQRLVCTCPHSSKDHPDRDHLAPSLRTLQSRGVCGPGAGVSTANAMGHRTTCPALNASRRSGSPRASEHPVGGPWARGRVAAPTTIVDKRLGVGGPSVEQRMSPTEQHSTSGVQYG